MPHSCLKSIQWPLDGFPESVICADCLDPLAIYKVTFFLFCEDCLWYFVTHTHGAVGGIWDTPQAPQHMKSKDTEFMDRPRRNDLDFSVPCVRLWLT